MTLVWICRLMAMKSAG
uniref:Uncharacterized protein n=1 Tax=Rhizophora mucronata TaxID=61149 RepID=A0A2P2N6V3_RHIMU